MSTCSVNINHFINQFNDHICCSMWILFIVYYLKDFRPIQRRQLKFPNYIQKIEKNIHMG